MSVEQPDVTVIVAAYNGMPYIEQMLASLLRQTIGLDRMQVIVVDDGSTDETPAVLDRVAAQHPSFEVIHQANFGRPAGPRNRALKSVRGRYIFFLDQDDYVSDDALEAMVRTADENGTDVVLARFRGVGGRGTPRTMFACTVPRTDVFSSSVYWTLNPMKLFRTEMVRSLDMRFDEIAPWGEDEPFTATAYLKGNGVSILADKDYVFWVYRDDRSNITTSALSLSDRMPVVDRMFDLLASYVPPGEARDRLMQKHFRVELGDSAFEGYRVERDMALKAAAFARFREIVDAYYTEGIEQALPPRDRVLLRLVSEDRAGEFAEYLDALADAGAPTALPEGEGLFLALPWFRDPARGLPDRLFDIAKQLRVESRVEPLTVEEGGLCVRAECRLGLLTAEVTDVELVLRPRDGEGDVAIRLAHEVVFDEVRPFVKVQDTLPGDRLLAGLAAGTYMLWLRLVAGTVARDRRVRECAAPAETSRIVYLIDDEGRSRSGLVRTSAAGHPEIRVLEGIAAEVRLVAAGTGPRIEVSLPSCGVVSGSAGALVLVSESGTVRPFLLEDRSEADSRVLAFDARGLASGTYLLRLEAPDGGGTFPLVAVNPAHRMERRTDGGGQLRLRGNTIEAVTWSEHLAERVRRRLKRLAGSGATSSA